MAETAGERTEAPTQKRRRDAIEKGELTTDTDVPQLVEMLVAVMWGMGFYAGYVGSHNQLEAIVDKLELLLANKLWKLAE